ncbi:SMI1/KNR4 family protein [Aeoliella sp. SH292]|uniref:SMI1/KNR4 family protein n=1 Tax=Aeoliella sp. SH292 TaxID=3454464 RepID=UPI003F944B24
MYDIILFITVVTLIYIALPVSILLARDWLERPSKQQLHEHARRFQHRLHHPDFAAVQAHFGRPLPSCVESLYRDQQELNRTDFDVAAVLDAAEQNRWYIAFYQPADGESVSFAWPDVEKYFAFADDGFGNGYLIDPAESDPEVLFHDHETGELSRVCDRFTEFMQWPRLHES